MTYVVIDFDLHPPSDTPQPSGLSASTHYTFEVRSDQKAGYSAYYGALRDALADARTRTGDELTAWRDIVGSKELKKEPRSLEKGEDDDEDGEDEEGEA